MNEIKQRLLLMGFTVPPLAKSSLIRGDDIVRLCFTCNTFTHIHNTGTEKITKSNEETPESFSRRLNEYVDGHFAAKE